MSLSTRAEIDLTIKRGPACVVCLALAELPAEDAAVLVEWMSNPRVPWSRIAEQTKADPDTPTLTTNSISRHAYGHCYAGIKLRDRP